MPVQGTKSAISQIKKRPSPPAPMKAKTPTKKTVNIPPVDDDEVKIDLTKPPEGLKLPRGMPATADLLYDIKNQRLAADKIAKKLKAQEEFLNEFFRHNLRKDDSRGSVGKIAKVMLFPQTKPVPENWDKLYKHIEKTGEFELLQRRLSEKAIKERWENKKVVPGVGKFDFIAVSVTKIS